MTSRFKMYVARDFKVEHLGIPIKLPKINLKWIDDAEDEMDQRCSTNKLHLETAMTNAITITGPLKPNV